MMRKETVSNSSWIVATVTVVAAVYMMRKETVSNSSWIVATVTVVATTTAGVVWYSYYQNNRGNNSKKCDSSIPRNPSGLLETLNEMSSPNIHNFLVQESNRLGSLVYRIWLPVNSSMYVVGDPYLARAILNDPTTEDRPDQFYGGAKRLMDGMTTVFDSPSSSPHWKAVRKGTAPAFSRSEIDRINHICEKQVKRLIDQVLNPCVETGGSFDPYHEMVGISFRVICEAAFEYPHVTDEEIASFSSNVETALMEFGRKQIAVPLRRYFTFMLPGRQRAFAASKGLVDFGFKILNHFYKTNEKKQDTTVNQNQSKTVIRLLINNPYLATDRMKVAEIIIFLIAGHDTTGFTLAAALFHQAKYPEVQSKLQESVRALQQPEKNQEEGNRNKDYLQWFLRESDRLLPVAATGGARVTGREFAVPPFPIQQLQSPTAAAGVQASTTTFKTQEMTLPKGAFVMMPQVIMNQSPFVFERPTEFDPMRWEHPENMEKVMPFSLGPRTCIGQALAKAELTTVISMLATRYSFELKEPGRVEYSFTLRMIDARLTPHKLLAK